MGGYTFQGEKTMYSLSTIKDLSDKAAKKARGKKPAEFKQGMDRMEFCRSIPNFGSYTPQGTK